MVQFPAFFRHEKFDVDLFKRQYPICRGMPSFAASVRNSACPK
jgi:hypothetical protein